MPERVTGGGADHASTVSGFTPNADAREHDSGRLELAFGRPVEVASYNFTLLDGPTLRAQSVTFGEDPRFGHEYFLRAESLTVRLRWQGLLLGRLQLGTVSLEHPSLNLVRNSDGDWNLAEWLPRPPRVRSARKCPPDWP